MLILSLATLGAVCACSRKAEDKVPAIDLNNLDESVSPGEDFYAYATGGWQKSHPRKPEYARYGSFEMLAELNEDRLNEMFTSMTSMNPEKGTVDQKIVDLYKMGLDSTRLNSEAGAPLKPYLDAIYSLDNKDELVKVVARMHSSSDRPFFGCYVGADMKNSEMQVLYLGQGGLGLRDRDYYLDPKNEALKEGYRAFLEKVFSLSGFENAPQASRNVLSVEEQLAQVSWTREQERDVLKQYNLYSSDQLDKAFPGFDFSLYLETRGIPAQDKIIVGEPSFFEGLGKIYSKTDLSVLKDYVAGQLIRGGSNSLGDEYFAAYFDFFSRQMSGIQQPRPRWKRAMAVPNSTLGEAVGEMYVSRYFPASSKERMVQLVENLRTALGEHIDGLEWMGPETKAKAREKLAAFTVKIGYPDKWKDYSSLDIDPSKSYYENLRAASAWHVQDNLSHLGKPTDRTEWGMSPQTVNAYYNPTTNEICFPAAILQPPFFNPDADDAVNYGAIGVVIGHEMSHGFDDEGRLFDKDGNMTDWWTSEDNDKFMEKAAILGKQFDEVEVVPGVHANGTFTMGENIGDHGGLSIAFTAMENAYKGKDKTPIDGFTPEQRFYLAYAAVWAGTITDEEKVRRTNVDPHSLAVNRVNVSIRNFQSFFDAFGIKEGDKMYRPVEERVLIW